MQTLLLTGIASVAIFCSILTETRARSIDEVIKDADNLAQQLGLQPHNDTSDMVKVEMDMMYRREDWEALQQRLKESSEEGSDGKKGRRQKRKAIRETLWRWSSRSIPYDLQWGAFNSAEQALIQQAVNEYNTHTCLTWSRRTNQRNYVNMVGGGGCFSMIGMVGGAQLLQLGTGCRTKYLILHEMGHAVGLFHEQNRPDRDGYIWVYLANAGSGLADAFRRYSTDEVNDYGVPYDYRSVMHYGEKAFSMNNQRTIVTKDPAYQSIIGNAENLSFLDIKIMNIMYDCGGHCGGITCPGDGYVAKDCKCYCSGTASNPLRPCDGSTGAPPTGGPTGGPPGGCTDDHANCEQWASNGECAANPEWMLQNCKKSCDVCEDISTTTNPPTSSSTSGSPAPPGVSTDSPPTTTQGPPVDCQDDNANCGYWASNGECDRNPEYMLESCKKSCDVCGGDNSCKDDNANCGRWASQGECANNPAYMLLHCAKSCNSC